MNKPILLLTFLFISTFVFAQINNVLYVIEYNESTDLFDCKMYIIGSATSAADRMQFPAQFSIVAETGITITIEETYLPLFNNETYTGTIPMDWNIENTAIDPVEFPGYNVFAIVPDVSGQPSHYNNLEWEDEITLFSVSATGADVCNLSLRAFENDDDPNIIGGYDFSNSMMIGNTNEIYSYNLPPDGVGSDVDITINEGAICAGECITLTATFNCVFPGLEYEWSTDETTESIIVCPEISTEYMLYLSGPFEYWGQVSTFISVDNGIFTDGVTDLCLGIPVNYLPETGIWSSNDESVVIVDNEGLVLPISVGSAIISHTTDTGNCLNEVVVNVQDPEPPFITGPTEICEGDVTQLSPSEGVTWESGNEAVATVDNSGLVTGVGIGATVFTYTTDVGQCVSQPTNAVSVKIIPEIELLGPDSICVSGTTTLSPGSGVMWESADISIATIDNEGNITGVSEGMTTFSFTDLANGCASDESEPIVVLPSPIVEISQDTVCQDDIVEATTNDAGGFWNIFVVTGEPFIPTIDTITGEITTSESGVISVQYVNEAGCISEEKLLTILPKPNLEPSSNSPICIGENLTLMANSPAGIVYEYQWYGPNGFSSNEMNVTISNVGLEYLGVGSFTLIASENGCVSEFIVDVVIEDCNPCNDTTISDEWIKIPVSESNFSSIDDYEVGSNLVSGRDLKDFVYYNDAQQDVRLIKNTGTEFFEEEIVLFDLPYFGPYVYFDIVDINQDGLKDIVTYQSKTYFLTPNVDTLLITIFSNKDNFSFESTLSINGESGPYFAQYPVIYSDLDNQGFLDIIPYAGAIYFTENWVENSVQLSYDAISLLIEDFNEDGHLDVLRNNKNILINKGDRTFDPDTIFGPRISDPGYYDAENQIFINPFASYQITTGENPFVEACTDFFDEGSNCFFTANINSSSVENGVNITLDGFNTFELPMTCENVNIYESNFQFRPNKEGKIDLTGNGYTDFITVENETIFAWINPNEQPKLRGTAFIDNNGDGILNENDSPLRNVLISIDPGNLSILTDENGNYQFAVPEGTYTLTAYVNDGEWLMDELMIENISITEPCNLGFDFGFVPDLTSIPMANLSMVNTIARCDFETRFTITVENTGTEPLEGQLQFEFDDKTTFFSSEISGATIVGNKVIADIGPLSPFQPQKYTITVKMPGGSSVLPILGFKVSLLNDAGEIIEAYGYEEQLRCSYDPNDKRVFPDREGEENLTLMDEDIEYTIRFQNNGNDTAYNVKIVDELDSNIDPSSIRVVGSSHDVETCIEGTELIFLFENIYLVDSTTHYSASQGYVTFKCNAKTGRAEFTAVHNTADIFFDTNLPIVTNQTLNTLVSTLCTDQSTIIDKYICDGEEYLGYSESGTYINSYELNHGCDSLVTINLEVQGITYSQQSFSVCGEIWISIGDDEYFIDENTTIIDTIVNDQGCISNILNFEITAIPDLVGVEEILLCVHESGYLSEDLDGQWTIEDEAIIMINEQGVITALYPGMTILHYLDEESGCIDEVEVEVFPEPVILNEGSDQICVNETNQLTSDSEGTWSSSDHEIATVTADGLVLGKNAGSVSLTFTSETTGCSISTDIEILPLSNANCVVSSHDLIAESVKIFPNPASGKVFLESTEKWNAVRFINAQGQLLKIELGEYRANKQIDISEISSGLYFVVLEMKSGIVVKKFMVD